MGKSINVTSFTEMEKIAKRLQADSDTYIEIYQQLLNEAQSMGTAWEGADNIAFVDQINGCADDLQKMAEKLSIASQALDQQRKNYVERQDFNIAEVKKLTN